MQHIGTYCIGTVTQCPLIVNVKHTVIECIGSTDARNTRRIGVGPRCRPLPTAGKVSAAVVTDRKRNNF